MRKQRPLRFELNPLPSNENEAVQWLLDLVLASDNKTLRQMPIAVFKRGWYSIGFLYAGLHPDSVFEHGKELSYDVDDFPEIRKVEPRLLAPHYVQSGWPVVLAPIGEEAWRRYEAKELGDDEFYCSEAVIAGMCSRSADLAEEVRQERGRASG